MGLVGPGRGRSFAVMVFGSERWSDRRSVDFPEPECPVMRVRLARVIWLRRWCGIVVVCCDEGWCFGRRPKGRRALVARGVTAAGVGIGRGAWNGRVCLAVSLFMSPTPVWFSACVWCVSSFDRGIAPGRSGLIGCGTARAQRRGGGGPDGL